MKARDIAKQYGFDKSFRKPFYAMLMLLFVISCFSLLFVGCSNTGNINYEESSIDNLKFRNISFGTEEKKTLATIKKDLAQQEYYEEPRIRDNSYLSNEHTATYYNINLYNYDTTMMLNFGEINGKYLFSKGVYFISFQDEEEQIQATKEFTKRINDIYGNGEVIYNHDYSSLRIWTDDVQYQITMTSSKSSTDYYLEIEYADKKLLHSIYSSQSTDSSESSYGGL